MNKYAVISTDNNPDYYSLIPLVAYSWHKLGYTPIVVVVGDFDLIPMLAKYCPKGTEFSFCPSMPDVKDSTLSQISRLFVSVDFNDDDIVVTGDGDMILMKDIFTSDAPVSSYGFDLTGRSELPICYIKANKSNWHELMKIQPGTRFTYAIKEQLPEKSFSKTWEDYWSVDQQLLTQRAREYGFERINFVDRGFAGPIAANRWDRYCWDRKPDDIIDVHCIRGMGNWDKIVDMAYTLWPSENWSWLHDYRKEFNEAL